MSWLQSFIILLGRLCFASLFLYLAYYTIANWDASLEMYKEGDIQQPQVVLLVFSLVLVFGGISLLFGWKTRLGAFLLLIVVGMKTAFFHDFWNMQELEPEKLHHHMMIFAMNIGIIGGLFYVLACGSGMCACDWSRCKKKAIAAEEE